MLCPTDSKLCPPTMGLIVFCKMGMLWLGVPRTTYNEFLPKNGVQTWFCYQRDISLHNTHCCFQQHFFILTQTTESQSTFEIQGQAEGRGQCQGAKAAAWNGNTENFYLPGSGHGNLNFKCQGLNLSLEYNLLAYIYSYILIFEYI